MRKNTAATCVLLCSFLAISMAVVLAVMAMYYPHNRYACFVKNIPPDAEYLSIVVQVGGRIENINYYLPPKGMPPSTISPPYCIWSYRVGGSPATVEHRIEFRKGERYGVIVRRSIGWEIIWSKSPKVIRQPMRRTSLELDLNDGIVQRVPEEVLFRLRMNDAEKFIQEEKRAGSQ